MSPNSGPTRAVLLKSTKSAHNTSNEYSVLLVYLCNNTVLKEDNQIFNTVWFWFILLYVDKCLIQDVFCLAHFSLLMFRLI